MGKGDRRTAKGKRYNSSYGNARLQATKKATGAPAAVAMTAARVGYTAARVLRGSTGDATNQSPAVTPDLFRGPSRCTHSGRVARTTMDAGTNPA